MAHRLSRTSRARAIRNVRVGQRLFKFKKPGRAKFKCPPGYIQTQTGVCVDIKKPSPTGPRPAKFEKPCSTPAPYPHPCPSGTTGTLICRDGVWVTKCLPSIKG